MDIKDYRSKIPSVAQTIGEKPIVDSWTGIDVLLPLINSVRDEGSYLMIKVDGERTGDNDNGYWTAIVSGGPLEDDFFRTDASSAEEALAYVIVKFAERCWGLEM